jgi:hypothetical protein
MINPPGQFRKTVEFRSFEQLANLSTQAAQGGFAAAWKGSVYIIAKSAPETSPIACYSGIGETSTTAHVIHYPVALD